MSKNPGLKMFVILIIIMMSITSFFTITAVPYAASSVSSGSQVVNYSDNSETYIIENLPYIWQDEIWFCEYGAVELVLRYYGINISQTEILYMVGGGYSMGYKPRLRIAITPPKIKFPHMFKFWTDETTGGIDDYKFLAQLYGLTFDYIYPKSVINKRKCWNEYWHTLKNYIEQDIPVITGIDPWAWPPFKEDRNLSITPPAFLAAGTHIVTVVGFNETDKTVCVIDPSTVFFNNTEKEGYYYWVDLNIFKEAVGRIKWEIREARYEMLVFENTSDEPLPKDLAADLIHQRNIQKLKGIKSAYDSDFQNKIFHKYGINAMKSLKKDIETKLLKIIPIQKLLQLLPLYKGRDPIFRFEDYFGWESINKYRVSQYLKENKDLNPNYEKNGILLEKESRCWENLSFLSKKFYEIIDGNNTFKSVKLTKPIVNEMVSILEDIIVIENMIIEFSTENKQQATTEDLYLNNLE